MSTVATGCCQSMGNEPEGVADVGICKEVGGGFRVNRAEDGHCGLRRQKGDLTVLTMICPGVGVKHHDESRIAELVEPIANRLLLCTISGVCACP